MSELDRLYLDLVHLGLVSIRNAACAGDVDWCRVEAEHIHEFPTLIGETNMSRHIYHATSPREAYLEWIVQNRRADVREHVRRWYAHTLQEIDRILGLESSTLDLLNNF